MSNSLNPANSSSVAAQASESSRPDVSDDLHAALGERFNIVSKLIESDSHSFYLAHDLAHPAGIGPEPCDLVRLRVLSRSLTGDRRQVELFRLEAAAAARLSHRNILKATPAEEKDGIHFCVIEERPGTITLREYLKRKGWLEEDEAVQIVRQVADALEHAHAQGVLHLRLEPGEVLIDQSGAALVGGFGIPRDKHLLWARQERSHYCAAPHISPEQILSGEVDQRSDLYLLGIIFFEMLTDRAPFESEDHASLRLKQLTRTPKPPHMFRFDLSDEMSRMVMGLLGKRPDERPFDVGVFKSALEQLMAGGMTAEERLEEHAPPSRENIPLRSLPVEPPADLPEPPEKHRPSNNIIVMPVTLTDPSVAVDERARNDEMVVDLFEELPPETRERERDQFMGTGAAPFQGGPGSSITRPLAWMLAALLIGGGLFGAIRGGQFKDKVTTVASSAEQRTDREPAASSAEAFVPTPEPATSEEAKELLAKSAPPPPAAGDTPPGRGEDAAVVTEKRAPEEEAVQQPSPRAGSETTPPTDSPVEPVPMPESASPAEVKEVNLQDRQSLEPAPVPEPPAKAEAPAPRVIRRSGDVLQNTAIIRHRPVYPKAAREAKIRGSVTVELTIDEEGSVVAARPISGPEQLRDAAVAAARRWRWTPARVDRNRAGVVGTITFVFRD